MEFLISSGRLPPYMGTARWAGRDDVDNNKTYSNCNVVTLKKYANQTKSEAENSTSVYEMRDLQM